jgi:hypothetical protein
LITVVLYQLQHVFEPMGFLANDADRLSVVGGAAKPRSDRGIRQITVQGEVVQGEYNVRSECEADFLVSKCSDIGLDGVQPSRLLLM